MSDTLVREECMVSFGYGKPRLWFTKKAMAALLFPEPEPDDATLAAQAEQAKDQQAEAEAAPMPWHGDR